MEESQLVLKGWCQLLFSSDPKMCSYVLFLAFPYLDGSKFISNMVDLYFIFPPDSFISWVILLITFDFSHGVQIFCPGEENSGSQDYKASGGHRE